MNTMEISEVKAKLLKVAKDCLAKGPGFAQEHVVLREAIEQFGINGDRKKQQFILTCWHDLFRDGTLSLGYDVDNPTSPFFHYPERPEQ